MEILVMAIGFILLIALFFVGVWAVSKVWHWGGK